MICEIVRLPTRPITGSFSTLFPRFNYHDLIEDVRCFGNEIELQEISKLPKYKIIDKVGGTTSEIVAFGNDELDLKKKWWTSKAAIYPIFSKQYKYPIRSTVQLYRFLEGTSVVIDLYGYPQQDNQETLYSKSIRNLRNIGITGYLSDRDNYLASKIVDGDDSCNISNYIELQNMQDNYEYSDKKDPYNINGYDSLLDTIDGFNLFPSFDFHNCNDVYLNIIEANDLKNKIGPEYDISYEEKPKPVFPLIANTADWAFGEDNEFCRPFFHDLIWYIENSSCTDIRVSIEQRENKFTIKNAEIYSRYIGISPIYTTCEFKHYTEHLINLLRKWAYSHVFTHQPNSIIKIELVKSWYEEVYITLTINNVQSKYYVDLATYSLGCRSFDSII